MEGKNKDILLKGAELLGIHMDMFHVEQFDRYYNLLIEWNNKMNLTAITEEHDVVIKHFLDSLSVFKSGKIKKDEKIIDIGAGAGFPSIPVKIVFQNFKLTIIDSLKKRTIFLNELKSYLKLKDVDILHGRAEDLGRDSLLRENYDIALARAVASLNVICEYCLPFVKKNGYFIALKGPNVEEEIYASYNALKILNSEIEDIIDINLPYTDILHKLIVIKKYDLVDIKYPRKPKAIETKPL
ncbi:16S rRNA (guanine(527)-N(7))-methyltransferase RsmG [Thermoanaerobacterium sp. RBIITD]|uniref:16S rRNA (guanine(527)-N(7))-methyltransferase RsmG n=1 Tax=Thermoanaerobacterium sp. RBIITD TaxID=1550240 RepID=UPI000BB8AFD9|nr:16S rRNA (guanine(527)-N(7))-methyltransferase RsmG [Thermoanaerobacterium sp. RBIITD]SNX53775.1 16S rRNA (guanine527-N7)-methyltransferase [Thermoanaerobacterium sp. RBIITD]